jgi:two-component sensor histidine kinase/CheY-like chemotaxis protein
MKPVRILLLEDSDLDADLIVEQLAKGLDFSITRVADGPAYAAALEAGGHDLILSDFSLPGFSGADALRMAREKAQEVPFIFVSGVLGEEFATESLKEGATDYVLKQRLIRLPSAVVRALNEARERRERRQAEEQLQLLVAELSHRVKNTLASVSSIARMTLKRSKSLEEFEDAFLMRLQALSEAHTLLFQANWGDTALHKVVERALKPFREDLEGVRVEGEDLPLPPKSALALTLMLHELATNAAKYGALSRHGGELYIRWRREADDDGDRIALVWRERGGPPVRPPERKGFGHTLIERSSQYELDGGADIRFEETGLEAEIRFPPPGSL